MSQFSSVRVFSGALKSVLPAAAFALSLAAAAPGHATQYFLQSDTMNTSRTATISGPGGFSEYAYIAPIRFTAFEGTGATPATGALGGSFGLLAFCVDIYHDIGLGTLNLKYDDNYGLTTNSKYQSATPFTGATTLTSGQIDQVGSLVNYGTLIYDSGAMTTDKIDRLAGLQGAIWKVINPGYNVVSGTAAVNSYIGAYSGTSYAANLTGYGPVGRNITLITETGKYGTSSAHQSFAFAGVPEPSTWIMLIAGFGMTGALIRRSRRLALVPVRA